MTRRLARTLVPSIALLLAASAAGAQSNAAIAESLFREGKKLLEERHFDEACPKFRESARLDPSSGVELALGLCYEGQGKTASAWGAYVTAASLARRDARHDRELAANKHASALEPKLPHVTLVVAPETVAVAGLVVKQDAISVGSEAWKGSPVDPGTHTLEVTAPGRKSYTTTFEVAPAEQATVKIPALESLPPAPTLLTVAPPSTSSHLGQQAGFVVGGVGVATLVVGVVLGIVALHDASGAHAACPTASCNSAKGVSENGTAGTTADWSTAMFVAGGVAVAAGGALVLFTGRSRESAPAPAAASVTPVLGPGFAGLSGRF